MMPCRTQPRACGPGGVSRLALFTVALAFLLSAPVSSAAQNPPLPPPSQAQSALQQAIMQNPGLADSLRRRLQASGLTPEQIRARLAAAGYPAGLFDAYMGATQPGQAGPQPGALELTAIQALGLGPAPVRAESIHVDTGMIRVRAESLHAESLAVGNYVFGVDVFRRTTNQFLPLLAGPVPPDYRLGPGDQLVLILTGEVELSYTLPVTREGFILIPHVGQIYVVNLTLDQLRDVLYTRLGRVYSGVRRGTNATTRFDVTVANVRANQIYVVGEVQQPGAYQISSLGTVFTALYAAGGVTERTKLRTVDVRRGGKTITTLDLYDYLLRGDTRSDIRLETGDVIFVPIHGTRVELSGAVVRPAIYSVRPGEGLANVIRAAGGFRPDAALRRITVYRILSPSDRGSSPSGRVAIDIALSPVQQQGRRERGEGRSGDPQPADQRPSDQRPADQRSEPLPSPFSPGLSVAIPSLALQDGDSIV